MDDFRKNYKIPPDLIWRYVDNDAVIVSSETGKIRVLNGVGSFIWQLLVDHKDIEQIEAHMLEHYDISLEQARTDLQIFLAELGNKELVAWDE